MNTKMQGWFEVLKGHPEDIVAISAHGHITRADYDNVMIPLLAQDGECLRQGQASLYPRP